MINHGCAGPASQLTVIKGILTRKIHHLYVRCVEKEGINIYVTLLHMETNCPLNEYKGWRNDQVAKIVH